ncbi:MAG: thiamine biosynthesis protein ThiS [Nitrospirae bacterium GWC2_57_13]|jgi:sulfur carrier protein|nr:MAG: thiamine biosynthesis protein ThiS [Nitrospirae bacterium GWC1_57_7]OGW28031.1 MAG: thiamine biosynthesis protein ThiS [Nitrospirae bacterium GWC2_57_13]OGW46801.1 MAG: thiamine biosynthesis protein ThiS [Nitrospirae bacterium GWD2_57_8]
MNITLNGEKKEVPDGITVLGLLQHLTIQPERVAIELNESVVRKKGYSTAQVQDGDRVEIVSFMGGGAYGASRPCRRNCNLRTAI